MKKIFISLTIWILLLFPLLSNKSMAQHPGPPPFCCHCHFYLYVVELHVLSWVTNGLDCSHPTAGLAIEDIYEPWGTHSWRYVDSQIAANECSSCGCLYQYPCDDIN